MLIRSKRSIVAGSSLMALALSVSASAADSGKTNIMVGGQSAKLSTMYRSEMLMSDHGMLAKGSDHDLGENKPTKTTNIGLNELKMGLDGQLTKDASYSILLDFVRASKGGIIEYAKFDWWFTDMVGFSGGKLLINQGGWEFKNSIYSTMINSTYVDSNLPLANAGAGNAAAWQVNVKAGGAGAVTLQLTDDVTRPTTDKTGKAISDTKCTTHANCGFNSANKQPAWTLEYAGDFSGIKPLLQFGSYDINHSKYIVVGVGYVGMGLEAYLDYVQDSRMFQQTVGADDKKLTDTITNTSIDLAYTLPNVARPFLKYTMYNVKDAAEDSAGQKDLKYNTYATVDSNAGLTDNSTNWALGSSFLMVGNHFRPYVALANQGGKFLKNAKDESTESKSTMMYKLGVMGEF